MAVATHAPSERDRAAPCAHSDVLSNGAARSTAEVEHGLALSSARAAAVPLPAACTRAHRRTHAHTSPSCMHANLHCRASEHGHGLALPNTRAAGHTHAHPDQLFDRCMSRAPRDSSTVPLRCCCPPFLASMPLLPCRGEGSPTQRLTSCSRQSQCRRTGLPSLGPGRLGGTASICEAEAASALVQASPRARPSTRAVYNTCAHVCASGCGKPWTWQAEPRAAADSRVGPAVFKATVFDNVLAWRTRVAATPPRARATRVVTVPKTTR